MRVKAIFPADERTPLKEFIWDAPASEDAPALEETFREFNVVLEDDSHIARECRSMSVGDMAICIDAVGERIYICDPVGWKRVTDEEAKQWMKLPFRGRLFGFQFMMGKEGNK